MASLVKQIDSKIGENKSLKGFVVLLARKGDKAEEGLEKLATSAGIKHVPLTLTRDPDGVPDYELSREADITVVMWSHHAVKAARGFKGDLTEDDIRAILSDLPKVLDK
ncbi:hypothetical protein [Aquisphaera giovannonii]|uniref:hypothetical protein n=1 Tax=Aquisphaera giovannonii TaxID=406548 RepID=UPI0011DF02C5|nr:hypothetical protein [Aquisphaera giovannonii]